MATKQDTLSKLASYDGVAEDPVGSNHILFNEWHYGRRQAGPGAPPTSPIACTTPMCQSGPGTVGPPIRPPSPTGPSEKASGWHGTVRSSRVGSCCSTSRPRAVSPTVGSRATWVQVWVRFEPGKATRTPAVAARGVGCSSRPAAAARWVHPVVSSTSIATTPASVTEATEARGTVVPWAIRSCGQGLGDSR